MDRTIYALVAMMSQWFRPRYNTRIQMLEFQIRMLRSRIDASRIVPTPKEKAELIRLGTLLDHDVLDIIHVVRPETYRTWLRHRSRGYIFKKLGRPLPPERFATWCADSPERTFAGVAAGLSENSRS